VSATDSAFNVPAHCYGQVPAGRAVTYLAASFDDCCIRTAATRRRVAYDLSCYSDVACRLFAMFILAIIAPVASVAVSVMHRSAYPSVASRSHRREWALLSSFHSVCLSVGHSATYSLPRLIDHSQIWSAGIYLSSDPCKPFWIPYLPYFGCQRENMQNFAYFQRVFLPLRTWPIVPYDLSVCLSVLS